MFHVTTKQIQKPNKETKTTSGHQRKTTKHTKLQLIHPIDIFSRNPKHGRIEVLISSFCLIFVTV